MITRSLNISKYIDKNQSLLIFGPRGVGKTNLVRSELKSRSHHLIFDFLAAANYRRYLSHPELLGQEVRKKLSSLPESAALAVFIDEIQKIPIILDEVHTLIESADKARLCFIMTGSSARKLKRTGANLLASRALMQHLHPLNSRELTIDLERALQFGTLPHIYLEADMETERLDTYVTTYLREEVQEEALVRQTEKFVRFLEIAGQFNGEPINFTKLGKACGVTHKTAIEYFSILEDTLLVKRLDGWAHSIKRQLMQAPKFYFFDCGVLNAINGELQTALKPNTFRYGRLFENWIIQEIVRMNDDLKLGLRFNYWRDADGKEVDLVISRSTAKPLLAIEIKSSTSPDTDDVATLNLIAKEYPEIARWCICQTPRAYSSEGVEFTPWQDAIIKMQDL